MMENTTPQTLSKEFIGESTPRPNELSFEVRIEDTSVKPVKVRPPIYDEEIGLWEELEIKYRHNIASESRNID